VAGGCTSACGFRKFWPEFFRNPQRRSRASRAAGVALPAEYDIRFSFCCAEEGCRKRVTPASLRFLGRRVYLGLIVVLVAALRQGASPTRVGRLRELVGVSRRTVERWCRWWRSEFVQTPYWRLARGRFAQPMTPAALPSALLVRSPVTRRGDWGPC